MHSLPHSSCEVTSCAVPLASRSMCAQQLCMTGNILYDPGPLQTIFMPCGKRSTGTCIDRLPSMSTTVYSLLQNRHEGGDAAPQSLPSPAALHPSPYPPCSSRRSSSRPSSPQGPPAGSWAFLRRARRPAAAVLLLELPDPFAGFLQLFSSLLEPVISPSGALLVGCQIRRQSSHGRLELGGTLVILLHRGLVSLLQLYRTGKLHAQQHDIGAHMDNAIS
ncbi:hypothetical protein CENSYa_0132 [Cenarchaeum symbiosum A]|uniref:Uncharacterized protein n=1 Tax=Cenarchaeum symbiosum (strain A) TaxID=414004 RepID=A0RTW0_CENSY|nr:hypothetical protein CENSYa_0132 [Cenarchaeum symbiosum A]